MFLKAALFFSFPSSLQITLLWDAVQTNYYIYSEYDNISLPLNEIFGPWGYASSSPHKTPGNWIRSAALLCTYNTGTCVILCSNLIYRTRRCICRIYFRLGQLSSTFITSFADVDWSQRKCKGLRERTSVPNTIWVFKVQHFRVAGIISLPDTIIIKKPVSKSFWLKMQKSCMKMQLLPHKKNSWVVCPQMFFFWNWNRSMNSQVSEKQH